jgi:hypothetical protein
MAARSPVGRLLLLIALLLGGCSQFAVHSERDPGADFTRRRTYAWLPLSEAEPADQRVLDRYIDARIRTAVDTELRAKGYAPAGSAAPDLLLNYRLSTQPAAEMRGNPGSHFIGAGWHGWPGANAVYAKNYDEGTLYLAAIDPASRQMIWLGAASARILPWISLEKRAKRVDDAVHQILAPFPAR